MDGKFIVGCLGSLGFGCALGYYIGNKVAMAKAQKMADEQVEDTKRALKAYYENKIAKIEEENDDKAVEMTKESDMGVDPDVDEPISNVVSKKEAIAQAEVRERFPESDEKVQSRTGTKRGTRKNETVMKRPKNLPPDAVNTPDGYPDPNDKKAPPYLIREEDYGSLDDWDTLELILFKCGTVTTDDSMCEPVSPTLLLRLLPEGWPDKFGWDKDGKYSDTLCVRNNAERRDIQIIKDNRTYREWVSDVYPGRLEELEDE